MYMYVHVIMYLIFEFDFRVLSNLRKGYTNGLLT